MTSITERLHKVEDDFLDSLISGESALVTFIKRWSTLSSDIEYAIQSNLLDESTKLLAHITASRIEVLAENLVEFRTKADVLALDFEHDIEQMLTGLSLEDTESNPTSKEERSSHIKLSYEWLLCNLHDPYPSKNVKSTIARQSGCSIKDVDNWFIDTRRRIGWNEFRRVHFSNKRQSIVEAATLFFARPDVPSLLAPEVEMEFAKIEMRAKELYATKADARSWNNSVWQFRGDDDQSSFSCRFRSGSPKQDKPFVNSSLSNVCTVQDNAASLKRGKRHGDCENQDELQQPTAKKRRIHSAEHIVQHELGSPSSSVVPNTRPNNGLNHASATATPRRKRCLSESASSPGGLVSPLPRNHTVSNPLPCSVRPGESLEKWFREDCNLDFFRSPDLGLSDPTQVLDIELFDPSQVTDLTPGVLPSIFYNAPNFTSPLPNVGTNIESLSPTQVVANIVNDVNVPASVNTSTPVTGTPNSDPHGDGQYAPLSGLSYDQPPLDWDSFYSYFVPSVDSTPIMLQTQHKPVTEGDLDWLLSFFNDRQSCLRPLDNPILPSFPPSILA